jgi:hypothetical protein
MPTMLENLRLEEVSLVDKGASIGAHITLFKRDNSEKEVEKMTDEMEAKVKAYMMDKECGRAEAMKALGYDDMEKADVVEEPTEVDTLKADLERLTAENERLRKGLIEEGYVIKADVIEKKAQVEVIEVGGEFVAKADIPAPVLKALEAAEVAKKEHEIEKADIELTKKAEATLPHFSVDVAKALVKSFSEEEAIMSALVAADKAFAAAMQEFGKSDVDGEFATAADKLDTLVKRYMDENNMKKSEYAKAYAAVAKTDDGKSLINKSYKGE